MSEPKMFALSENHIYVIWNKNNENKIEKKERGKQEGELGLSHSFTNGVLSSDYMLLTNLVYLILYYQFPIVSHGLLTFFWC